MIFINTLCIGIELVSETVSLVFPSLNRMKHPKSELVSSLRSAGCASVPLEVSIRDEGSAHPGG